MNIEESVSRILATMRYPNNPLMSKYVARKEIETFFGNKIDDLHHEAAFAAAGVLVYYWLGGVNTNAEQAKADIGLVREILQDFAEHLEKRGWLDV